MKWTKEKPTSIGWYWHRDNVDTTAEVWCVRLDSDGKLVVGFDTAEDGIHRPPRKIDDEFLPYADEEWSSERIPEPTS